MCLQVGPETVAGYSVMVLDAAMGALHLPQNPWADVVDFSSSTYSVWSQPSDGEFFGFSRLGGLVGDCRGAFVRLAKTAFF